MRPAAHRASRSYRPSRARRGARGATTTEYAIILFLVAVVAGTGFRFFGGKIQSGMDQTTSNLENQDDGVDPKQTEGSGGGGGAALKRGEARGMGKSGGDYGGFGGPRKQTVVHEESSFAKFALIALCVIGGAAAFFAAVKGKTAR